MSDTTAEYLKFFGEIKFAEERSLSASDFESSFRRHFTRKEKRPRGSYKIAELNNAKLNEFGDFLIGF
ncbi:MAG: hypothetical protein ACFFKA_21000 [Candidatus Thorarchaeota archaeon]